MAAPILVFGVQRFILMPLLDARTVRIIAGETIEESQLHLVFVVLELLKVGALIAATVAALRSTNGWR